MAFSRKFYRALVLYIKGSQGRVFRLLYDGKEVQHLFRVPT